MCRCPGWLLVLSTHGSRCGSRGWPPPCPSDAGTDPSTTETSTNPSTEQALGPGDGWRGGCGHRTHSSLLRPLIFVDREASGKGLGSAAWMQDYLGRPQPVWPWQATAHTSQPRLPRLQNGTRRGALRTKTLSERDRQAPDSHLMTARKVDN